MAANTNHTPPSRGGNEREGEMKLPPPPLNVFDSKREGKREEM